MRGNLRRMCAPRHSPHRRTKAQGEEVTPAGHGGTSTGLTVEDTPSTIGCGGHAPGSTSLPSTQGCPEYFVAGLPSSDAC